METKVQQRSPLIRQHSWGYLLVEGREDPLKDAKCFPGGARAWDWRETGTRHDPGVQIADAKALVEAGAEHIVVATGYYQQLQVPEETIAYLKDQGLGISIAQTDDAVERYNQLARNGYATGGLFHSTC